MNCLPCFQKDDKETHQPPQSQHTSSQPPQAAPPAATASAATSSSTAQTFTFRELAMATKNFRQECLLGEGGFGRVFKGKLQSGQVVAVKQLDRNGMQGNKEFLVEVLMLTLLQHPNLVNLIGYCADGDQRLLVYEFMPSGSLEDHLFGNGLDTKPLDWSTRMKIAAGAAKGLEYLHEKANPPIIYRDLRPSNVLLDESFNPKLSDFGLAKLGAGGGTMNVMGTYGYAAPEYSSGGELTVKSDIYSFGVVLLELISGRRAVDTTRPNNEQNLVTWAQPIFRDPKRFPDLADPSLNKQFPLKSLNQAVGIAAMCLQEEPEVRPFVSDVVSALGYLSSLPAESFLSAFTPPPEEKMEYENDKNCNSSDDEENDGESVDDDHDKEESDDHNVSYRSDAESIDKNGNGSSRKSEDVSSDNESSQTSSSSRGGKGSEPRKSVLTFKEPKLSSRERKKQSLSSSNESSSESEDESKPTRH